MPLKTVDESDSGPTQQDSEEAVVADAANDVSANAGQEIEQELGSSLRRAPLRKAIPATTKPPVSNQLMGTAKRERKARKDSGESGSQFTGASFSQVAQHFKEKFAKRLEIEYLSTGSINLDKILGGGLVRGKIYDLHSPAGLGKSTLTQHISKTRCKDGGRVLICDSEFAITDSQIDGFGLREYKDSGLFNIEQVSSFSEVEEVIDSYLACTEIPDIIVVDSATDLKTSKFDTGEQKIEDIEPGWQSRLLSNFFLKYKSVVCRKGFVLIMINQMRTKINFSGPSVQKGGGGNPMEFYPDVRLQMGKEGEIKDGNDIIGVDAWIKAIKNKMAMPFVPTTLSIIFGKGISNIRACTFLLQQEKAVVQSGSSFYVELGGMKEGVRGRIGLENWIRENEAVVFQFLREKGRI